MLKKGLMSKPGISGLGGGMKPGGLKGMNSLSKKPAAPLQSKAETKDEKPDGKTSPTQASQKSAETNLSDAKKDEPK